MAQNNVIHQLSFVVKQHKGLDVSGKVSNNEDLFYFGDETDFFTDEKVF